MSQQQRKYKCAHCDLSFRRTEHLIRHNLTHTNEKPFVCNSCERGFSRLDALQRHQKIHRLPIHSSLPDSSTPSPLPTLTTPTTPALPFTPVPTPPPSFPHLSAIPSIYTNTPLSACHQNDNSDQLPQLPPSSPPPATKGPAVCPARLRELSSLPVTILANGDRALYQCPVKGCKAFLTGYHLSYHLDKQRHTPNTGHEDECSLNANQDLVSFVDHIFNRHGMDHFCRDCQTDHVRADYFSVENAPCIMPACPQSVSISQHSTDLTRLSINAILAANVSLPPVHSHSDGNESSLLTLAHCAAEQLARSPSMEYSESQNNNNLSPVSELSAAEAHKVRIQDLLN